MVILSGDILQPLNYIKIEIKNNIKFFNNI
jgi:hypothetical protein